MKEKMKKRKVLMSVMDEAEKKKKMEEKQITKFQNLSDSFSFSNCVVDIEKENDFKEKK